MPRSGKTSGKTQSATECSGIECLDKRNHVYAIENLLTAAEDVTQLITKNLRRLVDQKQVKLVRIALREMIINAIEHGNLGISFREKSKAMLDDSYFDFVARRRNEPQCRDRRVIVSYMVDEERIMYVISDEGDGFDHRKVMGNNSRDANRHMLAHGRGISMAKNIFDSVRYNKKGNQVKLVKKINKKTPPRKK
ncbi:MAG TPA: ATP-binding protein [Spirochaetota bacterium]|nr:ATP-binding protein [Spirochaetota bacterium]HOD14031.1 ATP-binding protein [Spirochaetota bacterium]HPG49805.1 ATP-binding protein [Spirochaetota bacterium]HPN13985.1 ATP-binding protein [Spirochaetota bacterium]HQL82717.1 ATP-binding protein [Spirochaetota bacterium]